MAESGALTAVQPSLPSGVRLSTGPGVLCSCSTPTAWLGAEPARGAPALPRGLGTQPGWRGEACALSPLKKLKKISGGLRENAPLPEQGKYAGVQIPHFNLRL